MLEQATKFVEVSSLLYIDIASSCVQTPKQKRKEGIACDLRKPWGGTRETRMGFGRVEEGIIQIRKFLSCFTSI